MFFAYEPKNEEFKEFAKNYDLHQCREHESLKNEENFPICQICPS